MTKKPINMSGILTSNATDAKPLAVAEPKPAPATKPVPKPKPAPAAAKPQPVGQMVGLTHKLDTARYEWLRNHVQAEQRRRGDYRYSGQQFYVETLDTMRAAVDSGLTIAEIKILITETVAKQSK
jgi:hypothetical protein